MCHAVHRWLRIAGLAAGLAASPALLADAPPRIVTTIQPIHSLIAGVTEGISEPYQLVRGGQSPHNHSLSPTDAREFNRAAVVFAAGESIEGFLIRAARSLPEDTRLVWLEEIDAVTLHEAREGGGWEAHDHGHDDHDHDHDHDHGHSHDGIDGHLWLDPRNAAVLTEYAADLLAEIDPDNAARYRENATRQLERLDELERELDQRLAAIRGKPYLVFHDAYQYFEHRFDLAAIGSVTIDPERPPGARRINELSQRVDEGDVICVFAEPQFEPRVISVINERAGVRTGQLDPLGARIEPGPDAYFELLRNLARDLEDCLAD